MGKRFLPLFLLAVFLAPVSFIVGQQQTYKYRSQRSYLVLDDAQLDMGIKMNAVFALDDRAPLSANPHFRAMLNLIRLGASLEALLQGMEEPVNDIDMNKEFGNNGYNKTVFTVFVRYGWGESTDVKLPKHFLELCFGPGYYKEGRGMNVHLDYRFNVAKTPYGAGGASIGRAFDYEVFVGGRAGFDWSFRRSEGQTGFFAHLNDEIQRIAEENEFTAAQLIKLQKLAEESRILLPEDVGGRALHIGPIAGAQLSKKVFKHARVFAAGTGLFDMMDWTNGRKNKENRRSQHQLSLSLGLNVTLGSQGEVMAPRGFF